MEFSIKLYSIKSGYFIVHIEGSHITLSKKYYFSLSKDQFVSVSSADPDEMLHKAVFYPSLHCLLLYLLGYYGQRSVLKRLHSTNIYIYI